jgi:hypothetical protein
MVKTYFWHRFGILIILPWGGLPNRRMADPICLLLRSGVSTVGGSTHETKTRRIRLINSQEAIPQLRNPHVHDPRTVTLLTSTSTDFDGPFNH